MIIWDIDNLNNEVNKSKDLLLVIDFKLQNTASSLFTYLKNFVNFMYFRMSKNKNLTDLKFSYAENTTIHIILYKFKKIMLI